MLLFKEIKTFN